MPRGQKKETRVSADGVEERECSSCVKWFPLSDYHVHGRYLSSLCKPCERIKARDRARANVDKHRATAKAYAAANPERVKANLEAWRAKNKDRLLAYYQQYNASRRESMRLYALSHNKSPEGIASRRKWEKMHGADKAANRRAKIAGAFVEHVDRNVVIKRDARTCHICGKVLKWRECTLDHVIPLAKGGSHSYANIKVACGPCNFSKQARLI